MYQGSSSNMQAIKNINSLYMYCSFPSSVHAFEHQPRASGPFARLVHPSCHLPRRMTSRPYVPQPVNLSFHLRTLAFTLLRGILDTSQPLRFVFTHHASLHVSFSAPRPHLLRASQPDLPGVRHSCHPPKQDIHPPQRGPRLLPASHRAWTAD
jgi:hypothetical protein